MVTDNDLIEQMIFESQLDMVKREMHFGIIDYCSTYSLMKRIEMKIKGFDQYKITTLKSPIYANRSLECVKTVFE